MSHAPKLSLPRYVRDAEGTKVPNKVTSVNITEAQAQFLKDHRINLSGLIRDVIDQLIRQQGGSPE